MSTPALFPLEEQGIVPGALVSPLRYEAHAFRSWMSGSGVPRMVGKISPDLDVVLVLHAGSGPRHNGIFVLLPDGSTAWANGDLFRVVQSPPALVYP